MSRVYGGKQQRTPRVLRNPARGLEIPSLFSLCARRQRARKSLEPRLFQRRGIITAEGTASCAESRYISPFACRIRECTASSASSATFFYPPRLAPKSLHLMRDWSRAWPEIRARTETATPSGARVCVFCTCAHAEKQLRRRLAKIITARRVDVYRHPCLIPDRSSGSMNQMLAQLAA